MMLAWMDYRIVKWFDAKTLVLLAVLGFLAYLVSRRSPLVEQERDRLALAYPFLLLVYSYSFALYLGYHDGNRLSFASTLNAIIVNAFGIGFSIRVLRIPETGTRF